MRPIAIRIDVVLPSAMRYQTVGDWQFVHNELHVTVADSGDARTNLIVGLHEAIEALLYIDHGGSEKAVDDFDLAWNNEAEYDEAGDDPAAPYHQEHVLATIIERLLVREHDMTWEEHEKNVEVADADVARARARHDK